MIRTHNRRFAAAAIALCLAGCNSGSGGGIANAFATLEAGAYIAKTDIRCGEDREKGEGDATVAVNDDQVTLTIEDMGVLGPMTLEEGRMQVEAFEFTVDLVQFLVEAFQLNLTNDNRIAGDFTFTTVNLPDPDSEEPVDPENPPMPELGCTGTGMLIIEKERE